jgi:hypothetical protein
MRLLSIVLRQNQPLRDFATGSLASSDLAQKVEGAGHPGAGLPDELTGVLDAAAPSQGVARACHEVAPLLEPAPGLGERD